MSRRRIGQGVGTISCSECTDRSLLVLPCRCPPCRAKRRTWRDCIIGFGWEGQRWALADAEHLSKNVYRGNHHTQCNPVRAAAVWSGTFGEFINLFFQTVRNEVRRIRVEASCDVLYTNGVVRLMHTLIDCTKLFVFNYESQLFFWARELLQAKASSKRMAQWIVNHTKSIEQRKLYDYDTFHRKQKAPEVSPRQRVRDC